MRFLPLLFFLTCLSCTNHDSSQTGDNYGKSQNQGSQLVLSRDSVDKVIQRQRALQDKVYETQEKNRDTSKLYIFFTCTVMDKSNKYIDLLSKIYTVTKGDKNKPETIKSCLVDIVKKHYYLNSDVIPVLHEFAIFKEANENRAQYTSAQEIVLDSSCK